jgi:hypothetical protein
VEKWGKQSVPPSAAGSPRVSAVAAPGEFGAVGVRACSACAGDYEDPERTAWPVDEYADEEFSVDEFPSEDDARYETAASRIAPDGGREA